jgi:hypothetical protein
VEAVGAATPPRIRRSGAVLGFRNLPGHPEDNWLSPAFAEMLNTELAANGALRMVPGEDITRVKRELPLPDEDSLVKGFGLITPDVWRSRTAGTRAAPSTNPPTIS